MIRKRWCVWILWLLIFDDLIDWNVYFIDWNYVYWFDVWGIGGEELGIKGFVNGI